MQFYKELYYGWLIVIVQEENVWMFECHEPEGIEYVDECTYEQQLEALSEARYFIHKKLIQQALSQVDVSVS